MHTLEYFKKNGFMVKKNLVPTNLHEELFYVFYDLSKNYLKKNKIKIKNLKKIENTKYPQDLKYLDYMLISLLNFNKNLVGEIYDIISYTSSFLKIVSLDKVENEVKKILSLKNLNSIYSWKHRVRIDPPNDVRRTYGWHQEIFYTIPETRFVQTWCPIIRDTTKNNGTLEICPKSHKEGIAKQTWKEIKGRATQILVDNEVVNKYKKFTLPMKVGDILFFDPHLFHRSGTNLSNEVRFSMVGMWNDCTFKKFTVPKPHFQYRTISEKQYYNHYFNNLL